MLPSWVFARTPSQTQRWQSHTANPSCASEIKLSRAAVLNWGDLGTSQGTSGVSGGSSSCHNWGTGAAASSGQRSGMLLHGLQCTGQPPRQGIIQPQKSIVPRLRNPGLSIRERLIGE